MDPTQESWPDETFPRRVLLLQRGCAEIDSVSIRAAVGSKHDGKGWPSRQMGPTLGIFDNLDFDGRATMKVSAWAKKKNLRGRYSWSVRDRIAEFVRRQELRRFRVLKCCQ